jgi:hypothetical protein
VASYTRRTKNKVVTIKGIRPTLSKTMAATLRPKLVGCEPRTMTIMPPTSLTGGSLSRVLLATCKRKEFLLREKANKGYQARTGPLAQFLTRMYRVTGTAGT